MNTKALKTLEFDKIINLLTELASSDPGKELCRALEPMTDPFAVNDAQLQTSDALGRLFRDGRISFGNVRRMGSELKRLEVGASWNALELLRLAKLLQNVSLVQRYAAPKRDDQKDDCLDPMFRSLDDLKSLRTAIDNAIISEDEISDHASPRLASIRRNIRLSGDRIRVELNKMISGSAKDYLQDALITMRNGRFCIPVRSGNQSQIPGIVHDTSSSGNTVFIEPASVVKLNNEIRELEAQEQEEIEAILADLSAQAAEYTGIIASDIAIMTELDFIFAKAALAMRMNATRPIFNDRGIIELKKARHPLLNAKKVVPIDISLGEDFDMLIITGPNTGGKTVSLKTLGLLLLMGLSGLHIPCADRSRLGFYKEIYADIGDEQSIEQSLSTFSGHMANIVSFWEKADTDSLVLFDELGAGTDPVEGAALASAILKGLLERGVRTAATTHYSELKVFAMKTDRVVNGSCEFNVETLSPTYRLMIGLPGKSNAFAISQKLGLPEDVILRAKEEISDTQESFEDLLTELEMSRRQIEKDRDAIAKERQEIENLRHEIKEQKKALNQKREKLMAQTTEEASRILQKAKDYADQTIRYYNKHGGKDSARELEERRATLRGKIDSLDKRTAEKEQPAKKKKGSLKPGDLRLGDDVRVLSLGLNGTVNSLPDAKGMLFVTMGIMRSKVSLDDLEKIDTPDITGPGFKKSGNSVKMGKSMNISPEINLLGKTVDEAISELDKYLDDASLAHLPSVRIVHGKGTGALRKAVHDFLRTQKRIKSYRLGEFGEGDSGVTIAEFR